MLNLIRLELFKIFSKWRTYIGFLVLALIIPLIQVAMHFEGQKYIELATQNLKGSFNFSGNLLNGYMVTRVILQTLIIQVPILVSLVAGDMLAGEATSGTYRLLLIRPVSRLQVVTSKFIAGLIYTFLLILFMAVLSLGLSLLIFGTGEMIIVSSSTITILLADDVLWRFGLAFVFAFLSMSVVFSFSFLFSAFVENSIGPIITTMGLLIVFSILNVLGGDFFNSLQPFLFTTYLQNWKLFFESPYDKPEIILSIWVLLGHILVLNSITFYYFNKKDIHS